MSVDKFNRFMISVITFAPALYMTVDRWWLGLLWLLFGVAWAASSMDGRE